MNWETILSILAPVLAGLVGAAGGLFLTKQKQEQLRAESDRTKADTVTTMWQTMKDMIASQNVRIDELEDEITSQKRRVEELEGENAILRRKLRAAGVEI